MKAPRAAGPAATRAAFAVAVALACALGTAAVADAERLQVCTLSFHGPEEVGAFRAHLPAEDFEIVDLGPKLFGDAMTAVPPHPAGYAPDVGALCDGSLRCDVVVFSAEFAGRFFGRCGQSLGLREMEEASCRPGCDGLFHDPREVFLLACNTLATKDADQRTPEVYLQVLLDHGFDQASAERVVAMRYGPLGPTFREALRRIFAGVPRLYGFSSVAPLGQYSGPMLDRYFAAAGDYRRHLDRVRDDGAPNRALLDAFAGAGLVQTRGLMPGDASYGDRDLVCALYDESRSVAERVAIVQQLLDRPDLLAFVPSIQAFVDRHPGDRMQGEARRRFDEIRDNRAARDRVLGLIEEVDVSALQVEIALFAVEMGWMSRDDFRALANEGARKLLRRALTTEVVDVMCEVSKHERVGDQFRSEDLPELLFADPEGIRLVSCLSPPGDRVTERLAAGLRLPDEMARPWAAHALTRRLPLPDRVLVEIAPYVNDPSPGVSDRVRWIFRAQRPLPKKGLEALRAWNPRLAAEVRPGG
jgi:hypothetical protein